MPRFSFGFVRASSPSRRVVPALAGLLVLGALSAAPAQAVNVTITYDLSTTSTHTNDYPTLLGGALPTFLQATVIVPLATVNTGPITGVPSLLYFYMSNTNGGFALSSGPADVALAGYARWERTGAIPTVSPSFSISGPTRLILGGFGASIAFTASGTTVSGSILDVFIIGTEVSRVVPEPSTTPLLLMAALPFAAYLLWRGRRTRNARESRA